MVAQRRQNLAYSHFNILRNLSTKIKAEPRLIPLAENALSGLFGANGKRGGHTIAPKTKSANAASASP